MLYLIQSSWLEIYPIESGFQTVKAPGSLRLQKAIAQAGLASRRAAEELIRQGRVLVNDQRVTTPGHCIDPQRDVVKVNGKPMGMKEKNVYVLLHKPRFCITSARDPQGRKTVFHHVQRRDVRLFPVGRLDYDAEGVLILTNDGELANRLQHPRYEVSKTYEVKVEGHPSPSSLFRLRKGVALEEGTTAPAAVTVVRQLPGAAWLRMVLHQGWNRQIKRMGEAVGHPVLRIKRVKYGPLTLGGLSPGEHRELRGGEVRNLKRIVGMNERELEGR